MSTTSVRGTRDGALLASIALLWVAGAAIVWRIYVREVDTYGLERSVPGTLADPIALVPALLTTPCAVAVGWALRRGATRWPFAVLATGLAVAVAVLTAAFVLALRFAGDETPVETVQVDIARFTYAFTAALFTLTATFTTWLLRRPRADVATG